MKTIDQRNLETVLRDSAFERGATVRDLGEGHFQIHGAMLVNYYPFSKKCTAYLAATTHGRHHVTPQEAVAMAFTAPPVADDTHKHSRGNSGRYARWKRRQWKAGFRSCFWCNKPMNRNVGSPLQMTVDHKVPLNRGGLDNPNNWVGAHAKCNHDRGCDMPELNSTGATENDNG